MSHLQLPFCSLRFSNYRLLTGLTLAGLFLGLNSALLWHGIRHGADTVRYLDGAQRLFDGQNLTPQQATFSGYIALVAISQYVGTDLPGVVMVQLAMSMAAAVALYDLGTRLAGRLSGTLAAALIVGNPDIARWNAYVLTDSLYTSLVAIFVWCLERAQNNKPSAYCLLTAVAALGASMRPHGWTLVLIAVVYGLVHCLSSVSRSAAATWWAAMGGLVVLLALFIYRSDGGKLAQAMGEDRTAPHPLLSAVSSGVIIWGYEEWRLPMPPHGNRETALTYAASYPRAVARLMGARVAVELVHARPFYSKRHNTLVALYLTFLYSLAAWGIAQLRWQDGSKLTAIILAHLVLVAATWADWDGRFLIYILPTITLLAACGIATICRRHVTER